jgi:alpha-1,6-mannosyltransferase
VSIKTLHITNYWHGESGGIATFYRELLNAAERLRRTVRLVVPGPVDSVQNVGAYGRIYRVAGRASRLSPGYRLIMPHSYLAPHGPLRKILDEERPDLVECCDRYTLNYLAGLLRRGWLLGSDYRPAVAGLHCERMDDSMHSYISSHPFARSFCGWYLRWLGFPMCDHHIAVSDYVASELRGVARGHDVRRGVWVRPHGVDAALFRPERRSAATRSRLESLTGAPEGSNILLYAGRLAREKNLELLLDTMEVLEHAVPGAFHLLIAGDGPLRPRLERECRRRLPGAFHFLGHISDREQLAGIYANSDFFIHPNPREPFGIAPLEAMASGLTLVAPRTGGVSHYADSANACLAEPSAEAFACAIRTAIAEPDERLRRRRAARATAERFDWEQVTADYFDLYDELYALVHNARHVPAIAPSFYSTGERRPTTIDGGIG